ncbi:putative cucumisin [Helianthus annuus]|nr:putative cucumisin [Helianthus annuus]
MSAGQAKKMENLSGVLSVRPEGVYQLHTTRSPYFLGLRQNSGLWKDSNRGKGIIIGVLDSGITPGHPSFYDDGVPAPPSTWKGKCEVAGCNNKLIDIRSFIKGVSPIDKDGHGTHTASTAAGNLVDNANVSGLANGTASGMAPLAHLAIYKVCTYICMGSSILVGMDAAIEDGVNVMSIAHGASSMPFYKDNVAVAAFNAMQEGISVSCSAGNYGPSSASLLNEAPWVLTVGASTIDRRFRTTVRLGNNKLLHGESLYQPKDFDHKLRPLVYPTLCDKGSLEHVDVKGKVVLWDVDGRTDNIAKGMEVKNAGGAAMIIANDIVSGERTEAEPRRGPNIASPGILKPDITGPGVKILAAWPQSIGNQIGTKATFYIDEGTSMSCPHLAGITALLKSVHPEWSPAAIKSAMMTTASQVNRNGDAIVDERGLPADVFALGSGHVNPQKANEPGLVFDIQPDDYIPYLCGLGYTPEQIEMIVKKKASCLKTIPEAQLNYPSFLVSLTRGDRKIYSRTVTNVGLANSSYNIRDIYVPNGVSVEVNIHNRQDVTSFTAVQQKQTYEVTFTRDIRGGGWFTSDRIYHSQAPIKFRHVIDHFSITHNLF